MTVILTVCTRLTCQAGPITSAALTCQVGPPRPAAQVARIMILHFLSGKMGFFVKQVQIIWCKMAPLQFSHKVHHILWIMSQYYEFSSFLATFAHLNDFMLISQK